MNVRSNPIEPHQWWGRIHSKCGCSIYIAISNWNLYFFIFVYIYLGYGDASEAPHNRLSFMTSVLSLFRLEIAITVRPSVQLNKIVTQSTYIIVKTVFTLTRICCVNNYHIIIILFCSHHGSCISFLATLKLINFAGSRYQ